ncbi:MAG: hypothetical protein AAF628_22200 [Planctomycetota bacterium]
MQHQTLLLAALLGAAIGSPALAQQPSQEKLIERKNEKLASEWLKSADWILDYAEAKKTSAETGKPIFAYFTRSYAF